MTSLALASPPPRTSPAVLEPRPEPVLHQLEVLHADLANPELGIPDLVDVHNRANVLLSYAREANLAFDLAFQAVEAKLRAERRVGQLLDQIIASSPVWESHPRDKRMRMPRGMLDQLGVSGSQSHRWRIASRLPDSEFEARLEAAREARRELSSTMLLRAARRLIDEPAGGPQRRSTQARLKQILHLMREISAIRSQHERQTVRAIVKIAAAWSAALKQRSVAPADHSQRPDVIQRNASCMLCARPRPSNMPARCDCGGHWLTA